jgi:phosphoesterase RecJ-like protein
MQSISLIYPEFKSNHRNIVVTMHQKPDPDAMGSSLGLAHFLRQFGHNVNVIAPTNWGDYINWMPGIDGVLDYEASKEKADQLIDVADWIFCLDFNIFHRTRYMAEKLSNASAIKILIDHHQNPDTDSFDYGISLTIKSSTSEMIYDLIVDSGNENCINTTIAECLYAGAMSDTGSFRFPSTTASVHLMVAALKSTGFNHTVIHENVYENQHETRLRFLGFVLSSRMEVLYEYNTAIIAISKADILKFNIRTGDTEGLVNFPLSIKGIKFSAMLIDRDEERKWSFRSKGSFDVNTFAKTYFQGGGHFNAAGGRSADSVEENVKQFKNILKTFASQLQ